MPFGYSLLSATASEFLNTVGAFSGFTGVALGAFGAHGLQRKLSVVPVVDAAQRMANWRTAATYHLVHTLAMLSRTSSPVAGYLFGVGNLLFSGSIYLLVLDTQRKYSRLLGPVTPLGGLFYLAGWVAMLWC
ncbi:uncharacterized protein EV422DRAFT_96731 [Fimicolochytrium jonesii]|uniref:uncharacterized protein n=1 Tax=Fimicolochytrium jonesii TaxID=1396493 RepID=UPI0022FE5D47|nr:uncharacterized protein EV422DRAFT_96731 [Fimicolochytrium jonesii]KAI8819551.1 hypothetical protein EV422DRAFT_96731 [Fimicolochytrium jonesii]